MGNASSIENTKNSGLPTDNDSTLELTSIEPDSQHIATPADVNHFPLSIEAILELGKSILERTEINLNSDTSTWTQCDVASAAHSLFCLFRDDTNFKEIRKSIQQQPQILEPLLNQISVLNPELAKCLVQDPDGLLESLGEDEIQGGQIETKYGQNYNHISADLKVAEKLKKDFCLPGIEWKDDASISVTVDEGFFQSRSQSVLRRRSWPSILERCDICFDLFQPLYWESYGDTKPRSNLPPDFDERVMARRPFNESRKMIVTRQISIFDMNRRFGEGCPTCRILVESLLEFHKQNEGLWFSDMTKPLTFEFTEGCPLSINITTGNPLNPGSERLQLHTIKGSSFFRPCVGNAVLVEPSPDLGHIRNTVAVWISDCLQHHKICNTEQRSRKVAPTRLIDVGGEKNSDVKLYKPNGTAHEYVALSYCWGESGNLKTTKGTLERFVHKGISFGTLPKTIQDPVGLARELGFQYIWVDALCIIQDDEDDWAEESSKMASIYTGAVVTFAATCAYDCNQGFLSRNRANEEPRPWVGEFDERGHAQRICLSKPISHSISTWKEGPTTRRAWTFQEQLLSTRIIRFTESEMIWDCQENHTCECGKFEREAPELAEKPLQTLFSSEQKLISEWNEIVSRYSGRELTRWTDRLPALSGIAHRFLEAGAGKYAAGSWIKGLQSSLAWFRHPVSTLRRARALPDVRRIGRPTWSWSSINDALIFDNQMPYTFNDERSWDCLEIIDVNCSLSTNDITGRVKSGNLVVSAHLLRAKVIGFRAMDEPSWAVGFVTPIKSESLTDTPSNPLTLSGGFAANVLSYQNDSERKAARFVTSCSESTREQRMLERAYLSRYALGPGEVDNMEFETKVGNEDYFLEAKLCIPALSEDMIFLCNVDVPVAGIVQSFSKTWTDPLGMGEDLQVLLLGKELGREDFSINRCVLLAIRPSTEYPGCFERVGLLQIDGPDVMRPEVTAEVVETLICLLVNSGKPNIMLV